MDTNKKEIEEIYDDPTFYQGRTIQQVKDSYKISFWGIVIFLAILLGLGIMQIVSV